MCFLIKHARHRSRSVCSEAFSSPVSLVQSIIFDFRRCINTHSVLPNDFHLYVRKTITTIKSDAVLRSTTSLWGDFRVAAYARKSATQEAKRIWEGRFALDYVTVGLSRVVLRAERILRIVIWFLPGAYCAEIPQKLWFIKLLPPNFRLQQSSGAQCMWMRTGAKKTQMSASPQLAGWTSAVGRGVLVIDWGRL